MDLNRVVGALVAYYVEEFLEDEDDEALWEHITVDINEFCRLGDPSFQWHFRVNKPVFELLLQEVGNYLVDNNLLIREKRPVAHKLLMVLWIMATPDSFRSVALRFAVSKSEVHDHYVLIIGVLREMADTYVTWPNEEERNTIKRNCQRISDFPGIVAPQEEKAAYRNYKFGYSIKVQAVLDDSLLVRDVYIGEVGSLHDARVFRRSPLCRSILQRQDMFSPGEHIIADSAYMLLDRVLVPFENNGHLTIEQRNYNRRLSKVRARVEHTFGRVDILWRRICYLPNTNIEYAVDHIAATIILHNFNIIHKQRWNIGNPRNDEEDEDEDIVDNPEDFEQGINDVIPDPYVPQGNLALELERMRIRGDQKRWDVCNRLAQYLYEE
ncbi:uncharacterized protein LOC127750850 [Frankliniella occidentalis]|uniref:Uncharacterized protein LOC127750850 n=1 Tax=Frankliniella occidentalis TaxID=133901 RepID=A0A9C6X571_FRAOC|nr:uncharacterized protein LOC127750850 [Frankliniella occidentalis]